MERNKYIYALAEASPVVSSDYNKGGTWAGAEEQLNKYRFGNLYIRDTDSEGLRGLEKLGAKLWPHPSSIEEFHKLLEKEQPVETVPEMYQASFF